MGESDNEPNNQREDRSSSSIRARLSGYQTIQIQVARSGIQHSKIKQVPLQEW